jgi:hypothetical protein
MAMLLARFIKDIANDSQLIKWIIVLAAIEQVDHSRHANAVVLRPPM